eukprot:scaffold42007_cov75-Phaeocystis_antarctica.AAC.4
MICIGANSSDASLLLHVTSSAQFGLISVVYPIIPQQLPARRDVAHDPQALRCAVKVPARIRPTARVVDVRAQAEGDHLYVDAQLPRHLGVGEGVAVQTAQHYRALHAHHIGTGGKPGGGKDTAPV